MALSNVVQPDDDGLSTLLVVDGGCGRFSVVAGEERLSGRFKAGSLD